jgi:dephospho-CoA kinase
MNSKLGISKPYLIGLTGSIGSGKSLALSMLRHMGTLALDADWLAKKTYQKGKKGYGLILKAFGKDMLNKANEIDRKKIANLVFSNQHKLEVLEKIVHPLVIEELEHIITSPPLPIIAIEAIKLFESGLAEICDQIWVVDADEKIVNKRLAKSRDLHKEEIEKRRNHQLSLYEIGNQADLVLSNNLDAESLWDQVKDGWDRSILEEPVFHQSVQRSNEIHSPFREFLIEPSQKNAERITRNFREIHGQLKTASDKIRYSDSFLWLCENTFWDSGGSSKGDFFLLQQIRQNQSKIVVLPISIDIVNKSLIYMMIKVQAYSQLQLVEKLKIQSQQFPEELIVSGFKLTGQPDWEWQMSLAGEYNIYSKHLTQ